MTQKPPKPRDLDAGARAAILRSCRGADAPCFGGTRTNMPGSRRETPGEHGTARTGAAAGAKDRNRETSQFLAEVAGRCGIHKPDAMDRMNIPIVRLSGERSMRRDGIA